MRSRALSWSLALLFAIAGVTHIGAPTPFENIVPPQLGNARFWVFISGAAELCMSALLVKRRTQRIGALLSIALLIVVFPANIYAALNDGYQTLQPPLDSAVVAWLRLPLQALLIWWTWRVASQARNAS